MIAIGHLNYLERLRVLIVAHCPLPVALQPLVVGNDAPTPEEMWAEAGGLRVRAPRAKRARAVAMVGASGLELGECTRSAADSNREFSPLK